jgi:uncharacterized OsmC-like protein
MSTELNGWNIEAMSEAIEGVKQQPEVGRLTWRSRVTWDGGFGLDIRTQEIEQLGEVMKRHFTLRGDHPAELLGNNTGPTAVETLLAALGACMAGTFAAQATARAVEIENLEVDVEAVIDLNGFFGLKSISPGLSRVKLEFRVKSEADAQTLDEILKAAKALSPVHDSLTRPVEVTTQLA